MIRFVGGFLVQKNNMNHPIREVLLKPHTESVWPSGSFSPALGFRADVSRRLETPSSPWHRQTLLKIGHGQLTKDSINHGFHLVFNSKNNKTSQKHPKTMVSIMDCNSSLGNSISMERLAAKPTLQLQKLPRNVTATQHTFGAIPSLQPPHV